MTADRPLRVLRLTPYYFLPDREIDGSELQYEPIGGMQVQIAQLTEELAALGVEQTLPLPRRPRQPRDLHLTAGARGRMLRLPITPIPTRSKGYLGLLVSWGLVVTAWALRQRSAGRSRRWDLIHAHCSELPWIWVVAVLAARILRRPLVLTVHCSAIVTFHPETVMGRVLAGSARTAERAALRRADRVVVLTDRIRREYLRLGLVAADRLCVVPDGVQLDRFPATEVPRGPQRMVLYCGRFAPEKGWHDYVDAARLVADRGRDDVRFVMCGDGNELSHCRRLIDRHGLTDQVQVLGHLGRDAVAAVMQAASVVVVPSRHEELGGTVLEALASGRAVIASRVGGLPEVIADGETGLLVPPHDPPALARALIRLLDDPELLLRLSARAPRSGEPFEMTKVAARMHKVYRDVTAADVATGARVASR